VRRLYDGIAREKNLAFDLKMPTDPLVVWADPDRVLQVLNNLVSNAFKFTNKGSVGVSVESIGTHVRITVSDTGSGIPREDQSKLFNKFMRSRSNTKGVKGTGLGLFISRSLIEAQGGEISVGENKGGGTLFAFTLPLPRARLPQNGNQSRAAS
jgi:signal transduction histidine kinase